MKSWKKIVKKRFGTKFEKNVGKFEKILEFEIFFGKKEKFWGKKMNDRIINERNGVCVQKKILRKKCLKKKC